jgi:hypothetical protein
MNIPSPQRDDRVLTPDRPPGSTRRPPSPGRATHHRRGHQPPRGVRCRGRRVATVRRRGEARAASERYCREHLPRTCPRMALPHRAQRRVGDIQRPRLPITGTGAAERNSPSLRRDGVADGVLEVDTGQHCVRDAEVRDSERRMSNSLGMIRRAVARRDEGVVNSERGSGRYSQGTSNDHANDELPHGLPLSADGAAVVATVNREMGSNT